MSEERTAFKHPNCGGVILQIVQDGSIIFSCDQCGESAEDIDELIIRGLVIIRTSARRQPAAEEKLVDISRLKGAESGNAASEIEN
jgi:hypothetical protein